MARKRTVHDDENKDRISELPSCFKEFILERTSTRDAARTSILSKKWRYIWASHPQLVLDKQFFEGITLDKRKNESQFVRIIDKILLLHNGPILKFILYIPPFPQIPDMDSWILILSRNELTYLNIFNCVILNPPLEFGGFLNLNRLYLEKISISPDNGSLISSLSALGCLSLRSCTGVENLKIVPPKLNGFVIVNNNEFEWQWCKISNSSLQVLYVALSKQVENLQQDKALNLMTLLANLPGLITLWLDGFSLKFLAAGVISKCPTNYLLKNIKLLSIRFNDLDQVSCALCLLRSSPYLQNLEIEASLVAEDDMEQHSLSLMEATANSDMALNCLRTVKLRFFCGLKAEVLFVKLLLCHSPQLQRMIIENVRGTVADELRFSKQLMRFHRASTMAEIIYE